MKLSAAVKATMGMARDLWMPGLRPILSPLRQPGDRPVFSSSGHRSPLIGLNHTESVSHPGRAPELYCQGKPIKTHVAVSGDHIPLTVIKGAGHEFIPLPHGENATTADVHSIRTKTESPAYLTSGFYKIEAGPQKPAHYTFEETKYVLSGQIDILDEATGITHHLVPGDFAFFYVGSKVKFSTKSAGLAFYAVTRPVRSPHPNLVNREEGQARL